MTMIEKMARAICYTNCITAHPGDVERATCQADNGWDMWVTEAKAALEALREPTDAMIEAGSHMTDDDGEGSARARTRRLASHDQQGP